MCLRITNIVAKIAKNDIICYKYLAKKTCISDEFLSKIHGKPFTAIIKNLESSGVISCSDNQIYFCTNNPIFNGRSCDEKFGYSYSWMKDFAVHSIKIDGEDYIPKYADCLITPYRDFKVEIGSEYTSEFTLVNNSVRKGLHAYKFLKDTKIYSTTENVIVKCIIPKGANYYEGTFMGDEAYASDRLKYVEIIN